MGVTKVRSSWYEGNLRFHDKSGNIITTINGENRKFTIPAGSELESLGTLRIGATALTATAANLNALSTNAADINALAANVTGLAAFITAGLGAAESVAQADHETSPVEVVAADDGGARACLIAAVCTADVAGSTKPTFNLGEADGAADKFIAAATLENAAAGDTFISAGVLTDDKAMQCTVTEGVEDGVAPAGAFDFFVLLLPTT